MENQGVFPIEDVTVLEVWARLSADARAQLVDVRTKAEWNFVGVPDLSALGRTIILMEWQTFPDGRVAPDYADRLAAELGKLGASKSDEVFFICRSGARSLQAARVMAAAGYERCRNVADGFEGPLDGERHRGKVGGWKAEGLAWIQG